MCIRDRYFKAFVCRVYIRRTTSACIFIFAVTPLNFTCSCTVSYTHLDVYKRQHTYCVTGIAKQRESIKDNIIDIKPPILLIPPFFSPINPYTIIILTNNILISIFLLSFLLNVKKQTKINSDSCLHKFTFYFVVTSYFNFIIA